MNNDNEDSSSSEEELHSIDSNSMSAIFEYKDPSFNVGIGIDISKNDVEEVARKISQGYCVRNIDNKGDSLLHLAVQECREDDLRIIDLLTQHEDIDINALNFERCSPLLSSIKLKKTKVALFLIEKGADVNLPACTTPLNLCVEFGLVELAETLIKVGADINAKDSDQDTPLHLAVYYNQMETMLMLLYHGAKFLQNEVGLSPFVLSIQMKRFDFADILIDYEAEFDSATLNSAIFFRYPNLSGLVEAISKWKKNFRFTPDRQSWMRLQKNPEMFKLIWTNFQIRYNLNDFLIELFDNHYVRWNDVMANCCTVMENENMPLLKLTRVSEESPVLSIICACIMKLKCHLSKSDEEFVLRFFSFLLSYGLAVHGVDLEVVYEVFGYGELFKLLLHMDIKTSNYPRFHCFAYFIYSVSDEMSFRDRVEYVIHQRSPEIHPANQDLYPMLNHSLLPLTLVPITDHRSDLTRPVPNLVDLARNRTRDHLCTRYKIKTTRQFYTMLKCLDIPDIIRKLIAFEAPVYKELDLSENKHERWRRIRSFGHKSLYVHYHSREIY